MIAGYVRCSTTEQALSGLGLAAQREAITAYASFHWPSIAPAIAEEHRTGTSLAKRPVLNQLIASLCAGDHLIVLRLDRLARNTLELLGLFHALDGRGAAVHSVREAIDTTSPSGRLFITVLGAMAQFESDLIAQRTRDAIAQAQKRGIHCGRFPYAWNTTSRTWNDAQLQTVRNAYLLHKCHAPLRTIASTLCLPVGTVRYLLANPIYRKLHLL